MAEQERNEGGGMADQENKIWAHSGDSHFLEPEDLWGDILPANLAVRMPRSEKISEDEERITVDGNSFTWRIPKVMKPRVDGKPSMMGSATGPLAHGICQHDWPTWTRKVSGEKSFMRPSGCGKH